MRFFFFGQLRDYDIFELVIGRPARGHRFVPATLTGGRLVRCRGQTYPVMVATPDRSIEGCVVEGLTDADVARIAFFESVEYRPLPVEVRLAGGGTVTAQAFANTSRLRAEAEDWHFDAWLAQHKTDDVRLAALWMSMYGRLDVVEADRRWEEALAAGRRLEDLIDEVCGTTRRIARARPAIRSARMRS